MKSNREAVWEVLAQINQVILGKETLTAEVLAAMLAGGHVLLEDLPGSGKTTLALALSRLLGLDWKRVVYAGCAAVGSDGVFHIQKGPAEIRLSAGRCVL